jgi:oligo-1,6-glucosidase/alpha-glucosidase
MVPTHEYPGGNFQLRKHSLNQPENFELAKELRQVIDEFQNPPRLLVGEVFGKNEVKRKYLGEKQNGLHLIFLFDILFYKLKAVFFRKKILEYEHCYASPNIPTFVFSNHDQKRSITRINDNTEKAKLLALLQFSVRAVPCIYYGEEIGMTDGKIPIKDGKDPMVNVFSWVPQFIANLLPIGINRDNCRTPMQWDISKNAGFSGADKPWLPLNKKIENINVAQQSADENSLLIFFKRLIHLRKNNAALHSGSIEIIHTGNPNVLAYIRSFEDENVLVLLNFGKSKVTPSISLPVKEVLFSMHPESQFNKVLDGYTGVILKI